MAQETLFDIRTKEINPYWVDPSQPLRVPKNPLHFEAHKMQLLIERLEMQQERAPMQFNPSHLFLALQKFSALCEAINKGATSVDEVLDEAGVAKNWDEGTTPGMGDTVAAGVDPGVPADNPLAG